MYRYLDAAWVRAPAYPAGSNLPPWPTDPPDDEGRVEWRQWVRRVWELPELSEAVEHAAPGLGGVVAAMYAGAELPARRERRATLSLARYALRWRHRATPFGLMAGTAPAGTGTRTTACWAGDHHLVARADSAWLADVISRLERCPALLRRLSAEVDSTGVHRDDRLVIACQQPPPGEVNAAPRETSVRLTAAVRAVAEATDSPITLQRLAELLAGGNPPASADTIDRFLDELVEQRVLLTSLRPPMTVTDGLRHVNECLAGVDAEQIPEIAPTVKVLHEIETALNKHNAGDAVTSRHALRTCLRDRMRELSTVVEQPVAVDLRLDCSVTLPTVVIREAERSAAGLTRLTAFPSGTRSGRITTPGSWNAMGQVPWFLSCGSPIPTLGSGCPEATEGLWLSGTRPDSRPGITGSWLWRRTPPLMAAARSLCRTACWTS